MPIEIGKTYRFDYPPEFVTLPEYTAHAGQMVKVIRPLTEQEADGPNQGEPQMWRIEAPDGWTGDAWEDELG